MQFHSPVKVGVLLMGSLYWEPTDIRTTWRSSHLRMDRGRRIPLPIRYGRTSIRRYRTYTMVYSPDLQPKQWGKGYFVPLRTDPLSTTGELHEEMREMIRVERNISHRDFEKLHDSVQITYDWSWGVLGYMLPGGGTDPETTGQIAHHWEENLSQEYSPAKYTAEWDVPAIDVMGQLTIPPPSGLDSYDLVITVVTRPRVETGDRCYPTPDQIARRMYETNCYTYFLQCLRYGITTFQDSEILTLLKEKYDVSRYISAYHLEKKFNT